MPRLGLALSGGGFRATLYHLGVIRFLRDAGQLQHVSDIASVSGGSILAAHMVLNWDRYNGSDEQFNEAANEIVQFVQFDIRNHIIRRLPLLYPLRFLAKLTPIDESRLTPNAILERYYRTLLYGDRRLYELPEQPALHILTTNISNGGLSVFNRQGLFIQQRDDDGNSTFKHIAGTMASLARVVGASSAFPGLFPPVKISATDIGVREGNFSAEWFTDGGVYDNLGIRAFSWLKQKNIDFDQVLVSDAGKPFQILSDASLGFVGQSFRATDILWDRVWQLERENFGKQDKFAFLPISEQVNLSEDPTALHPVVQAEVQSIRTDLDCFSDLEINALAQHGYAVARKICRQIGVCDTNSIESPPWVPIPETSKTAQSQTSDSTRAPSTPTQQSLLLRNSSRRRTWSTVLSPWDWTSYIYVVLALLIFVYLPSQVYQLYRHSQLQATVIEAIEDGDPDIHRILRLVHVDPASDWTSETIQESLEPTEHDDTEIEMTTYSRIIDLRNWRPDEPFEDRGHVYICDRLTLKLLDTYTGDRHITLAFPIPSQDIQFRQIGSEIPAIITRVAKPYNNFGEALTLYELQYDLSSIPLGETVSLELEGLLDSRRPVARAPFFVRMKTDLLSTWMLFPTDRPYRTFNLVNYPADRSTPPQVMDSRYSIDHPFGSIIGWSVVNPKRETVYECRWTTE